MNPHNHPQSKQVINRLSRAIGHLESVKKMAEEGRDCSEILTQISAVVSALNNMSKVIIEDHINHCVVEAAKEGDKKVISDLIEAVNQFVGIKIKNDAGIH
ncbi:MAG: metal-sensing transcriptional repressor [Clostridia bacterium]|nr:metal-sensing transcriptional repressor [Clostridia bacterium]